jgi:hypothetical protein
VIDFTANHSAKKAEKEFHSQSPLIFSALEFEFYIDMRAIALKKYGELK